MKDYFLLPTWSLCLREVLRFFRQRNRVIGALATPILFWILLGTGFSASFRAASMPATMTASEYFFPGTIALILLFTSIFSTISIIEDRREGFLQSVLTAPLSPWSVVLGKSLGSTLIAVTQAMLFLVLAPLIGIPLTILGFAKATAMMMVLSFALTALGLSIAWNMQSTMGFHAVMNLFLMPMWLLSGAFFPMAGAHPILQWMMRLNPMTYGVAGIRRILYESGSMNLTQLPTVGFCFAITLLFASFFFVVCGWIVHQGRSK